MKRLILMRHAKTEPWVEGIDDHARALTERGHADAPLIAEKLASLGWAPDTALVSSARRARETWTHLANVFPETELLVKEDLYLTGTRGLMDMISEANADGTLILVGHNPGMHDCAVQIMREGGGRDHHAALTLSAKMSPGSAALFEAEDDGPFVPVHFKLIDFLRAKDLRD